MSGTVDGPESDFSSVLVAISVVFGQQDPGSHTM